MSIPVSFMCGPYTNEPLYSEDDTFNLNLSQVTKEGCALVPF